MSVTTSVIFTGSGLDDLTVGGTYDTPTVQTVFDVEIDSTGTPDSFKWRKNGGSYTTGVDITGASQTLSNGVTVTFAATTGHTSGNKWAITISPAPPNWAGRIAQYLNLDAATLAKPNVQLGLDAIGTFVQTNIETLTGRPFMSRDYSEAYSGDGKPVIFLRNDPVITVDSVTISGTPYTLGDMDDAASCANKQIVIGADRASLIFQDGAYFPWGVANVLVDYSAGMNADEGLVMLGVQWGAECWKSGAWAAGQRTAAGGTVQGKFTDYCPPGILKGIVQYRRAWGVR